MSEREKLLPCPFCASVDIHDGYGSCGEPVLHCHGCNCEGPSAEKKDVVSKWNKRADGWQPIGTAPKDGSKIIATAIRDGKRVIDVTWWRQAKDGAGYIGWGEFNMTFWPPDYWMPLPAPPEDKS